MSRICIKNIPRYATEDRIREFFSQRGGEVTDTKLMRTKEGKSRQFAFIGFRTEKEAKEALNYFNNSYLDTCRITCEIARKVGDATIPRPWSRHTKMKAFYTEKMKDKDTQKSERPLRDAGKLSKCSEIHDTKLGEFLKIMQPRKSEIWGNDSLDTDLHVNQKGITQEKEALDPNVKKLHSYQDDYQITEDNEEEKVKLCDRRMHAHDKSRDSFLKQVHAGTEDDESDMDYFRTKVKKNWSDSESDNEVILTKDALKGKNGDGNFDLEDDSVYAEGQACHEGDFSSKISSEVLIENENPASSASVKNEVLETGRLFIRNLPYTTNEEELIEIFSKFGDVSEIHLVVDKETKRSKGIAYVLYPLPDSAARALEELDNSIFQGRLLHILPAKPRNQTTGNLESDNIQGNRTLKQKREDNRKAAEACGDTRAWNALFMRPDTVVENISRKHGINKSDILDPEADNVAVRIALGETQVISETKKALLSAGINVAALEEYASKKTDIVKRSNHVILVKNLPYSCREDDIANMFGKFGSLDRIILPPTKALALVIFLEAAEARTAFKGLAYKRYGNMPLYLEWAPDNILVPNHTPDIVEQKNVIGEEQVKRVLLEHSLERIIEEEIDPDRVESRSVFVKNLNFKTTDEDLKKCFVGKMKGENIRSAKVKKHIKKGKSVSMGFGFIEFDSVGVATHACKELQGTILDGHALILQLCHSKKVAETPKSNGKDCSLTKLIVRNVPFEATEKDLRQLFSPFGQLKRLRLPMKLGSHRGFAFVEYAAKQEAQNALLTLSNTHLYGRHLVLERAKEGESLEELRERTTSRFANEHTKNQKLSLKRKHASILNN